MSADAKTVADAQFAEKFLRIPLEDLKSPQKNGPLMVYRDHWWAVDDAGNALFFKHTTSPQCNVNRAIVERHLARGVAVGVEFVPWGYVTFNISDYS